MNSKYFFVSYAFDGGFGNSVLEITNEDKVVFPILEVQRKLSSDAGKDVCLLNYFEITKEEYDLRIQQNQKKRKLRVGDKVRVIDCVTSHEFNIGEVVELSRHDDVDMEFRNDFGETWFMTPEEFETI